MKKTRLFSVFAAMLVMISAFVMFGSTQAYAASLAKASVTLSNTSATSVKISWSKVSKAKKYTVYRSTKKSSGYKAIKTTTSRSLTSTGLTCGKTYYFKVKAINGSKSSTSSVKSIKVKPVKPTLKASKGCTFINLSWNKDKNATGYEIYSSSSKNGKYNKLATVKDASYKNSGLKLSTSRYYKVRAYKTVKGKKIYGSYSSVVGAKTVSAHNPSTSWKTTKKATCNATGTKTNVCSYCKKTITEVIPKSDDHVWSSSKINASKQYCAYTRKTCKVCKKSYDLDKKEHKYSSVVKSATCTAEGYTTYTCTREACGYSYKGNVVKMLPHNYIEIEVSATCTEKSKKAWKCEVCNQFDPERTDEVIDSSNPLGHKFDSYYEIENGYRQYYCSACDELGSIDYTCYIDLTTQTVSVPGVAVFGKSTGSTVINKLDLTPDGISNFEITGSAKDLTIDVNAKVFENDVEIKLNGVTIENQTADCFDIKNKSTDVDEFGAPIVPWVSISAKDGTVNTLKTVSGGNAIETSCKLELKGRGVLNMDTLATSISSKAKIEIKNLTLNITSKNRGIDTKNDILNDIGMIVSTDYSNIEIKPNAKITINSTDDGIRCKNMTVTALDETVGDVNSVINITAGKDGIQLEGKTGIDVYSGDITIKAEKYAFNCSSDKIKFNNGVSSAKCKGTAGFSK